MKYTVSIEIAGKFEAIETITRRESAGHADCGQAGAYPLAF